MSDAAQRARGRRILHLQLSTRPSGVGYTAEARFVKSFRGRTPKSADSYQDDFSPPDMTDVGCSYGALLRDMGIGFVAINFRLDVLFLHGPACDDYFLPDLDDPYIDEGLTRFIRHFSNVIIYADLTRLRNDGVAFCSGRPQRVATTYMQEAYAELLGPLSGWVLETEACIVLDSKYEGEEIKKMGDLLTLSASEAAQWGPIRGGGARAVVAKRNYKYLIDLWTQMRKDRAEYRYMFLERGTRPSEVPKLVFAFQESFF